jgi:hypothetical protein
MEEGMDRSVDREQGSVLMVAVIAMLVMGVLSVSFALLASLETKIGVNYTHQLQARALAEAALTYGRNAVAGAATSNFTSWLDGTASGVVGPNLIAGSSASDGRDLVPGQYWVRIDNNCNSILDDGGASAQLVPNYAFLQDTNCGTGTRNTVDNDRIAVMTAWATVGSGQTVGRARVRALIGVDDPWKHVCSSAIVNETCTHPDNIIGGGQPIIQPADTTHPNGPKTYPLLPMPPRGCSQIDPTMHGGTSTTGDCGGRPVITGDAAKMDCNGPNPATDSYSGYFDCALTTPCQAPDYCPPGGTDYTFACVRSTDTRANTGFYKGTDPVNGGCPPGATGMVFNYYLHPTNGRAAQNLEPLVFDNDVGSCLSATVPCPDGDRIGRTIYVLRQGGTGTVSLQRTGPGDTDIYGTMVVEGNGPPEDCAAGADFQMGTHTRLFTAPQNAANPYKVYGYPLAVLLYDPMQPDPTTGTRQQTCGDFGASAGNTEIHGIVFSGGKIEFNPIGLDGGVVAYDVEAQGGASTSYLYNSTYGNAAPPPGFPTDSGANIAILRKSFVSCSTFTENNPSNGDYNNPSRCR